MIKLSPLMIKSQKRTFSITLAATLSVLYTSVSWNDAAADDAPLCHDMSARNAVLDEGKQYLDRHGGSANSYGVRRPYGSGDAYFGIRWSAPPHIEISDEKIESMPLDSAKELYAAQG